MKILLGTFLILLAACSGQQRKNSSDKTNAESKLSSDLNDYYWSGTLKENIQIFLHYSIYKNVVAGNIVYTDNAEKKSKRILGIIESDSSFRLSEFNEDGNISVVITAVPCKSNFKCSWIFTNSKEEFNVTLLKKDTVLETTNIQADLSTIYGNYHYNYNEEGYQGNVSISKLANNKIAFNIFSVTSAPGRNMAEVPLDSIQLNANSFVYKMPESDSCEFKVNFFRNFLVVEYTRANCVGQFGWKATVEGIFLKTN